MRSNKTINRSLTVQSIDISSPEYAPTYPDMIEIYVKPDFLRKAEDCVGFMQERAVDKLLLFGVFGYTLFEDVASLHDDDLTGRCVIKGVGGEYVEIAPDDLSLGDCNAEIDKDGDVRACIQFKHVAGELSCDLGNINDLKARMSIAQQPNRPALELIGSALGSLSDACEQLKGIYEPGSGDHAETSVSRIAEARDYLSAAKAKGMQVVIFMSEGSVLSVAVRDLPEGKPPCVLVNYNDRDACGEQFPSPEDFEREMLGLEREEFDKSASYIY